MTTLYLIRHGTTDSNLAGVFQGCMDTPLNARGLEQAAYLAHRFADVPLDRVYASGLKRAQQTAQAICAVTGLAYTVCPDLNEINLGLLEGRSSADNAQMYPEAIRTLHEAPADFAAPGGESSRQVYDRMCRAIARIVAENPGRTVAVVSHGFSIQTYLSYAEGHPYENLKRFIVGNTAVSKFLYEEDGAPHPAYVNDQSHLPEGLRFDLAENQPA